MKKFPLFATALICLASFSYPINGDAQGVKNSSFNKLSDGSISVTPEAAAGSVSLSLINEKALKDFSKTYKAAGPASWSVITDGFTASFANGSKKSTVYYNQKGNWIGTVCQMTEKDLPKDVWHIFKSNYYDFNINTVREIRLRDHLVYIAYLENDQAYKNVKLMEGALEVIEEFKK